MKIQIFATCARPGMIHQVRLSRRSGGLQQCLCRQPAKVIRGQWARPGNEAAVDVAGAVGLLVDEGDALQGGHSIALPLATVREFFSPFLTTTGCLAITVFFETPLFLDIC